MTWAARLPISARDALAWLRRQPGLEVHEQEATFWLRGQGEALHDHVLVLPGVAFFHVDAERQLIPRGKLVPDGRLPDGPWQPLDRWLPVALPTPAWPGTAGAPLAISVVPSTEERQANVLLTAWETWQNYAVTAPQVRLRQWQFAATTNQAVIRGAPLPPLPGNLFCETDGIAVQAGYHWSPPIDAAIIRAVLKLEKGDLALLHADGSWELLRHSQFAAATRSAVRLTQKAMGETR